MRKLLLIYIPLIAFTIFLNPFVFAQKLQTSKYIPQKFTDDFCLISINCQTIGEAGHLAEWIGNQGGRIAVVGTSHYLIGWITPLQETVLLQKSEIRKIERNQHVISTETADEMAVISYFNSVVNGDLQKNNALHLNDVQRPDSLGCLKSRFGSIDPSNRNKGSLDINPMSICEEDKNSEYMIGTVSCGVFFAESDGSIDANTYTWTNAAITSMKAQIIDAFSIWSYTASQYGKSVSFTPVWYTSASIVNIPYEPITHPSTDDYLYINHIMNNLGYNLGDMFLNCSAFNADLKKTNGTDWAFSAFVVYNPFPAADLMTDSRGSYAYFGGPYMHVLYRYNGWAAANFYRTFGHETTHIFHAFDEYSAASVVNCTFSFNGVGNSNYHGSTCNGVANCIMIDNSFTGVTSTRKWNLCTQTISHIGWQNLTPAPQSLLPASHSNVAPGMVSFSWDRNTLNASVNSTLRILDSTNTVVYCSNEGSSNSASVNLVDGNYTWQVLNAIYPVTGGYAEVSSSTHHLHVACLKTSLSVDAKDTLVSKGKNAFFSVQASGTGTLIYQWQVKVVGGSWANISNAGNSPVYIGFNTDTLHLQGVVQANNGYSYRCLVTTACDQVGHTGKAAILSICPDPVVASFTGGSSACEGSTVYISAIATSANSYAWVVPPSYTIDSGQGTATIKLKIGNTSGKICVIPSSSCVVGDTSCFNFNVFSRPNATVTASGSLNFCKGDSIILTASNASNYLWNNGATTSAIAVKDSGNYFVVIRDANFCKDTSSAQAVRLFATVASISVNGTTNLCQGSSAVLNASKASSYLWSNSATTRSITVSTAGNYSVQIVDSNACHKTSSATTVKVFQLIAKSNPINGLTAACPNGGADYFLTPVANATAYTWTVPVGSTINSGQGNYKIHLTFGNTSGTVCVVASNGCMSMPPSCKSVVIGSPAAPGTIGGPSNFCVGGKTNVAYSIASVAGASSYIWNLPSGDILKSGNGTKSVLADFNNSSSTICVKSSNSCGLSAPSCLAISTIPPVNNKSIVGSANVCYAGTSSVNYALSSLVGNSSYLWTAPAGASVVSGQGSGLANISYSNSFTSGLLCVRSFNLCNLPAIDNCKIISDAPLIFNNILGSTTVPPGTSNVVYSIAIAGGATSYVWTVPNGVSIVSGQGGNSITLHFSGSFSGGSICVVAQNTCGNSAAKCLQVVAK